MSPSMLTWQDYCFLACHDMVLLPQIEVSLVT